MEEKDSKVRGLGSAEHADERAARCGNGVGARPRGMQKSPDFADAA